MSSHGCLTADQVLKEVRDLVRRGKIKWRDHADKQMARRGFERGQVKQCLLSGRFVEPPVIPNKSGPVQYEFKMHARIDGVAVAVVASLVPETNVVVISVMDR